MVIKQLIILSQVLTAGEQEEGQAGVNKEVCEPQPSLDLRYCQYSTQETLHNKDRQ